MMKQSKLISPARQQGKGKLQLVKAEDLMDCVKQVESCGLAVEIVTHYLAYCPKL
jgi:hypothetical protein